MSLYYWVSDIADYCQHATLLGGFFHLFLYYVVDVLLQHSANNEWNGREDQVIQTDIPIVEERLAGIRTEKCKNKLRNCKQHILVEEVQDHL